MISATALLKRDLRIQLRGQRQDFSPAQREEFSVQVRALLSRQRIWHEAKAVLFYAPLPDEIDLLPLLAQGLAEGKKIALPGFVSQTGHYTAFHINDFAADCAVGRFGVLEPGGKCPEAPLNTLDLALVPGVAFDLAGHRLGRGGGYYDRILAQITGTKCGVAFDAQIVRQIPIEAHDIQMNCLVTPTQWRETGERPILS